MEIKRCTKCGEEKPLDEFPVTKRDGVLSQCKECMRQYARERYKKPGTKERMQEYYRRPEVKERYRERYHQNPEVYARHKEYRQSQVVKDRRHVWGIEYHRRPDVKERERQWRREYRQRPEVRVRRCEYRQQADVKEKDRVYAQEYRQSPEGKERLAEYYKTPSAKFMRKNNEHKRRIYKKHACAATDEPITQEQWDAILKHQKQRCPDCGKRFTKKNPPTMDHIVPLSVVPLHSSDNIRATCMSCNARKRDRVVPEYIQTWVYANGVVNQNNL